MSPFRPYGPPPLKGRLFVGAIHESPGFALIRHALRRATFISALRAAFGGCAPKRACGRSPRGRLYLLFK